MQILRRSADFREAADKRVGQFADASNADHKQWIDSDTTLIGDGAIRAVFLRNVIRPHLHKLAFQFWKRVDEPVTNRPAAVGTPSLHRSVSLNGSLSPRRGVNEHVARVLDEQGAAQGILGWDAKNGGNTKMTAESPEMLSGTQTLIELVDSLYKKHVPTLYATQVAAIQENPFSRLWLTAFSNIYILKQWATAYHKDSNNLPGVLTAITACGTFSGGELVLPRWAIAFAFQPGDLLLFDPQQVHGNLPFKGERLSAAFYCGRNVVDGSEN